jgi:hypothetical protein
MKVFTRLRPLISLLLLLMFSHSTFAQNTDTNSKENNVYRPYSQRMRMEDSKENADTLTGNYIENQDSINAQRQHILDSIAARQKYIADSILKRELFVRDSLIRRKQIIDSLNFLRKELPQLLSLSANTISDDIILLSDKIKIVGDSTLTNYSYIILPNRFNEAYTPWKAEINLSDNPPKFEINTKAGLIQSIQAPGIEDRYTYTSDRKIIKVTRQGMFASKYSKKYYKAPIDSVFFNNSGQILKIKRYYQVYEATDNFQKGAWLFNYLWQVKQYNYTGLNLTNYELIKFCDRWMKSDPEKVCTITKYNIQKQEFSYIVSRTNDPVNAYSDGIYNYEFDNLANLRSVTFRNTAGTENWKTFIELNEDGYVSRYVYQEKGIVNRTLLVNYYLNNPKAKHKFETVTCTFEDDGISYYQINNTTGKKRVRDHFTGEWGSWE